jgi:hydroxyethylthiazole kinase-like uncharacterized protein yjeF
MKICSGEEMRLIDEATINKVGIPGIILMENAVFAVVNEIRKDIKPTVNTRVTVFCGQGNNGGDGFGIARHLSNMALNVTVVFIGNYNNLRNDAKINYEMLQNLRIPIKTINPDSAIDDEIAYLIQRSDIVVDAIFGTGLSKKIEGLFKDLIDLINFYGKYIISVDIPSGIDSKTGAILGNAVKADKTVTLALPKSGLYLYPGTDYVGELIIADIGIPRRIIEEADLKMNVLTDEEVKSLIPIRFTRSNKGTYGRVQVIAGSKGMTGAAALTCLGAYKVGTGVVSLGVPASINNILEGKLTEVITIPLPDDEGRLCRESFYTIKPYLEKAMVIAIGPGLGQNSEIVELMDLIIKNSKVPVLIDADGINAIARNIEMLKNVKVPLVLTPHPGEMGRLIGKTTEEILEKPVEIVRDFCHEWNVILVLKDAKTIIGHPNGEIYINTTGNSGMSVAGSGDVLTGIISGLIAQNMDPYKAAVLGVFLHGKAGDLAAKELGYHGMLAGDICSYTSEAIKMYFEN